MYVCVLYTIYLLLLLKLIDWLEKDLKPDRIADRIAECYCLVQVLEWLLGCREAQLNSKDAESGYSPLHRAAFHGQLRTLVWLLQVVRRKIFGAV